MQFLPEHAAFGGVLARLAHGFSKPGALCWALASCAAARSARADQTLQIDVSAVLNARVVTTFSGGKLVSWTQAIDTGYSGEATTPAAVAMGNANVKALPRDGRFPANAVHPEIVLNFNDDSATAPQVRRSPAGDAYSFDVPSGKYSRLILAFMCAGETDLEVQLTYDGTTEKRSIHVGDWYNPLPEGNPLRFNVADDLGKWNNMNHLMEANRHYVHGFDVQPAPERSLKKVTLAKPAGSVLTFWGATGVAKSLDAGSLGGSDAGGSAMTGGSSGGGSGGASGSPAQAPGGGTAASEAGTTGGAVVPPAGSSGTGVGTGGSDAKPARAGSGGNPAELPAATEPSCSLRPPSRGGHAPLGAFAIALTVFAWSERKRRRALTNR